MWEYFQAGGPMMWPLLFCSIVALAIILERGWFWHRIDLKKDEKVAAGILAAVQNGQKDLPQGNQGILTSLIEAGLEVSPDESGRAMEVVMLEALAKMRKGMTLMDTIITAAPMLGIMGTVLGIISSFDMLGAAGVSDPKSVIAGIAQALITTATGLGIAVVTIFPYNYFNSRIDIAQDLMEAYGSRLQMIIGAPNGE